MALILCARCVQQCLKRKLVPAERTGIIKFAGWFHNNSLPSTVCCSGGAERQVLCERFVNQIPDSVKSPRFPLCHRSEVGRGPGKRRCPITSRLATGPPTCRCSSKPCARCVPAAAVGLSQTAHSVSRSPLYCCGPAAKKPDRAERP